MAIMRWDPFGEVLRMQRDMDRIYSRMGMVGQGAHGEQSESWMPRIDIRQQGDDLELRAELPGMKPEDVDIEFSEGVLTLKGERKREEEREDEGWLVRESSYGAFERTVALPESVDPESISADYSDGILTVTVPGAFQRQEPQRKKIAVGGGSGEDERERERSSLSSGGQPRSTEHVQEPEGAPEQEGVGAYSSGHAEAEGARPKPGESHQQPAEGSREKAHV